MTVPASEAKNQKQVDMIAYFDSNQLQIQNPASSSMGSEGPSRDQDLQSGKSDRDHFLGLGSLA